MSLKKVASKKIVLVTWASPDSSNIGVKTLAHGAEILAKRVFVDSELLEFKYELFNNSEQRRLLSTKEILFSIFSRKTQLHSYLSEFDLILDTCGGDSFTDIYGKMRFFRILLLQRAAARLGIPLIMTNQTFGPFRSKAIQKIVGWHLSKNKNMLLICRETKSFEIARRVIAQDRLILSTDLAFYLEEESVSKRSGLALNVSGLLWSANSHVDYLQYRAETLRLLKVLVSSGLSVTIFENVGPFVGSTDDDSIATEFLKNQFGDSLQYLRPNTLFEAKQSLKTFEVVVAARMHACLNALAVGTPTIALAYSRKFSPIFGDLGWPIVLDLRDTEFFATEVLSLIPEVALRTLEARRVHGVALRQLESAEPKIRQWLAESQIHSTPSGSQ